LDAAAPPPPPPRHVHPLCTPPPPAPRRRSFDFAVDVGRNLVHGSDSPASAEKELKLWFPEGLVAWKSPTAEWVYE
jgi:nucleoside-diphosphate kinase